MAIKLHRCSVLWFKLGMHPCWKVQKALDEQGIEYEVVAGPLAAASGPSSSSSPASASTR